MAHGIEARVPLLDHHLVEFAAALPPRLKLRRATRKYLLRKVASKWLPEAVLTRLAAEMRASLSTLLDAVEPRAAAVEPTQAALAGRIRARRVR